MDDPSAIDWRNVIAGKDGDFVDTSSQTRSRHRRREIGFGTALAIAAFVEVVAGALIFMILSWHHPHYPNPAHPFMQVHLVPSTEHLPLHPSKGRRHGDPSAGRPGGRASAAKSRKTTGQPGGAVATPGNRGVRMSSTSATGQHVKSARVRVHASCPGGVSGCINPQELQQYLRRLHGILQQRLASLIHKALPLGSGQVVLRFVGSPGGGTPVAVSVVQAPTDVAAARKLRAAVAAIHLPGYPAGLGGKGNLSFKVALQSGGS